MSLPRNWPKLDRDSVVSQKHSTGFGSSTNFRALRQAPRHWRVDFERSTWERIEERRDTIVACVSIVGMVAAIVVIVLSA